jgi:hypothetical protein
LLASRSLRHAHIGVESLMLNIESKQRWAFHLGSIFLSVFTIFDYAILNGELERRAKQTKMLHSDDIVYF